MIKYNNNVLHRPHLYQQLSLHLASSGCQSSICQPYSFMVSFQVLATSGIRIYFWSISNFERGGTETDIVAVRRWGWFAGLSGSFLRGVGPQSLAVQRHVIRWTVIFKLHFLGGCFLWWIPILCRVSQGGLYCLGSSPYLPMTFYWVSSWKIDELKYRSLFAVLKKQGYLDSLWKCMKINECVCFSKSVVCWAEWW